MNEAVVGPPELVKNIELKVAVLVERGLNDDTALLIGVAAEIIKFFLGEEFMERYIRLSETPDNFMCNGFNDSNAYRMVYQDRVALLADFLFKLNADREFKELVKRFNSNRDIRSVFTEAMSASSFKDKTFNVEMVTASGIKTHDFDFKAINYRTEINVEVTACTNDRFSYKNLSNVLAAKRKQLPNNAPAILFCDILERWLSHYPDLKFGVMQTTFDFFKKSRRINAIVYVIPVFDKYDSCLRVERCDSFLPEHFDSGGGNERCNWSSARF
jgi:hypothetical protein